MLISPAIYGYGDAADVARIQTGHLIWNGASQAPGAVATDGAGTGSGTLAIEAERITFGYGLWGQPDGVSRSEEHTSELQSLMRISYAVFCLKKKKKHTNKNNNIQT